MPDTPISKPDIIVSDTGTLIHLAQAKAFYLLHEVGSCVVVPDMVAYEATQHPEKPGAAAIRDWLDAGQAPGSNAPVLVAQTTVGELFKAALTVDPNTAIKDLSELAIIDWLEDFAEQRNQLEQGVMVVYENGKVPNYVRRSGLDLDSDVIATRAFLELAEARGLVPDANNCWQKVLDAAPTANPKIET